MTQLDIFSQEIQQEQFIPQTIERKRLTPRQYRLHDLIHEHSLHHKSKLTLKEMLERLDKDYQYKNK